MIKSKITLKQLEAFVYVADTGTFRKAATALGTTQPNVSVRIAALEDRLGTVLMQRDAGSVRLTERGKTLLGAARDVLRAAEVMLDVAGRNDLIEDRMRLGVTELVASTWLHEFLRRFRQSYPGVRVDLTVNLSREVAQDLKAHQLELAILNAPFDEADATLIPVESYGYTWVAPPEIAQSLGATPTFAAVFAHPILTHARNTQAPMALAEFIAGQGLKTDQIVHSSSLTACLHMAADGMGVAVLPARLCADHIKTGRLVAFDCGWVPDPLVFSAAHDPARVPNFVAEAAKMAVTAARLDKEKRSC